MQARLYWSQSRLHTLQSDTRTAARYARKALEILELTEHTYHIACAHQLLAHIELDRGHAEEGLQLARRAQELIGESGSEVEYALFRLEEARALAKLGQREQAAALAMEVSGRLSDIDPHDAGRSYGLLAEIYAELGDRAAGDRAVRARRRAARRSRRAGTWSRPTRAWRSCSRPRAAKTTPCAC